MQVNASLPYQISSVNRFSRKLLRPVIRGIFHAISRVWITGLENVPGSGPYLIATNHISLFEPPFVLSFWPVVPEAVGAAEIWERRGQATLARLFGGIQVHRGSVDRGMLDAALWVLNSGYPLLIMPEGGRSHSPGLRKAHPGVSYLVEKTGAPVVPVGIVGTTDDFLGRGLRGQRPAIEMRIGCPMMLPPIEGKGEARRLARQQNADCLMKQIAGLLPLEYRGIYAN